MRLVAPDAVVWQDPPHPPLPAGEVHVWRVALDAPHASHASLLALLSSDERQRAARFYRDEHRRRYVVAHAALRLVLAGYVDASPQEFAFDIGEHGKPSLRAPHDATRAHIQFNLSHSAELALVAVARDRIVGVDVERWSEVEHLELAERFFSSTEQEALHALGGSPERLDAAFFAAWTRKEAYLKARGYGITRGLHHFDVTLTPGVEARLLADRLDAGATEQWTMQALSPAEGYSGALVAQAPLRQVFLFDAAPLVAQAILEASF